MALHRRCMSRGRGGCGWRGCSEAGAGRQFLSSGMSPPSPSLLRSSISPSPATCSSSRAGSSGAQHGLCLPPTAQLIPTDTLGVSRWREVPRNPTEPCRCQQRHQDCGNRLDQADTGAAVLGRETQRPPFRPTGGQGEPRAHPMASLAARTHEPPWFVNLVLVLQEHPHPQHPRRERAQGRPGVPPVPQGPQEPPLGPMPAHRPRSTSLWGDPATLVWPLSADLHHKSPILVNLGDLPTSPARGVNGFSLPRPSCHFD